MDAFFMPNPFQRGVGGILVQQQACDAVNAKTGFQALTNHFVETDCVNLTQQHVYPLVDECILLSFWR